MTRESLLDSARIEENQFHRVRGELPPDEPPDSMWRISAAASTCLRANCPYSTSIQRGMGPDAHTASLFPGEPLIRDRTGIAAAVWVEKMKQHRVTLLPGVLERARHTLCLATGAEKAEALRKVLSGAFDPLHGRLRSRRRTRSGISTKRAAAKL